MRSRCRGGLRSTSAAAVSCPAERLIECAVTLSGQQTVLLRCELVAWVDREGPGVVRACLVDATGREHYFVDKVPIFGGDFGPQQELPVPGVIRSAVLAREGPVGQEVFVVSTSMDHIASMEGVEEFRVRPEQLERAGA